MQTISIPREQMAKALDDGEVVLQDAERGYKVKLEVIE